MGLALEGKVAVVTGAASGIGKCIAERFLAEGAKVVSVDLQFGDDVVSDENNTLLKVDVTREAQVKHLMETAVSTYGRLDIVVNNAGIGIPGDITEVTEEDFDKTMAVNTKGVLFGLKHGAINMSDGGSIINTSSLAALIAFPSYAIYSASKAATSSLTKVAALDLAPRGIRVNAVCPGTIDTPLNQKSGADTEEALAKFMHPLGRVGQPEEVAALVLFLASDESSFMTGAAVPVDAGASAGIGLGMVEPLLGVIAGES